MKPSKVKLLYRPVTRKAAHKVLVGRNRKRQYPEKGRFTSTDVDNFLKQVWQTYDQLAPQVPREPKFGNRMNMQLACVTLACFQVLLKTGIEREYAIELIGDVAWKVYEKWGRIPIFIARLLTRKPREQMQMAVNVFLRFPFTPPGYAFDRIAANDGISLDMLRCPVTEYLQEQKASDLCIGTWCNLDFALAEMWGGWLERTETLSADCARCDFRFKANASK